MHRGKIYIVLIACLAMMSCAPKALREAKDVVAQADSMRAAGQVYADSVRLARSYTTLRAWRAVHADEYAHACYHYGRLLREKDNPVEAVQCFIDASHTRTRDYHILGRVYSNMGSICHLAGEFPLSYDMYKKSAAMFLHNGDSTAYFYALNDMAFELAENREFKLALCLLDSIKLNCTSSAVIAKTNETRIILFKHTHQYDSILYYFDSVPSYINNEPLVLISKAQAFCYLQQYDSATCYATRTLQASNDLYDRNNAFYILIHCDSIHNGNRVYSLNADRSDVQKLLEIRQGKLSQAVQLLEQDLHRKPNLGWLYAVCATLIVVGLVVFLYVYRKRRQRSLLSQQVEDLTIQNKEAEERQAKQYHERLRQIQENCEVLACSDNVMDSIQWKKYENFCEFINTHFFLLADKLKATGCLNEKEIRLCVLVLIGSLSDKQMANILYYSYKSIRSTKRTLAIKLGTTSANLRSFLMKKAAK